MERISYGEYLDKVHGCWYGKCLGGAAGTPMEGIKEIIEVEDFTEIYDPSLPNDDLDLQLLWLDTLERKGVLLNSCDLADAWVEKCWYPFSEYGYFLKNYMRGIKPPYSGIVNNEFFQEGMGCAIRSEIWGLICPGNPELAAEYAYMDAILDHAGEGVYAEQYLAAVESMAFFEQELECLLRKGMEFLPRDSRLYSCFDQVMEAHGAGKSWEEARRLVLLRFSHPDFTNVVQNMGFVLIALLYGRNLRDVINIALRCGYDTDCTCASAASVVGIMKGYQGLGKALTELIQDRFVVGIHVRRPSDSILRLAEDTVAIGMKTPNRRVEITGGSVKEERPLDFTGFSLEPATAQGLKTALEGITPRRWEIYGPYFQQPDWPMDPAYPSPHGQDSHLPDLVCMVNNEVSLKKAYLSKGVREEPVCVIEAYEDLIEVDKALTLEGQMCCYARTLIYVPENRKVWAVIGNNDGFRLWCNKEEKLYRDEIRYWTPYNNFTLLELRKGENEIVLKLLRRTRQLKFAIGFRQYEGCHWHRSKWCIDL